MAPIIVAMAFLCTGIWFFNHAANDRQSVPPPPVAVAVDMPTAGSLEEMVEPSTLVVVGKFVDEIDFYNQSRNPNNPAEENARTHRMARVFRFEISDVLKGTAENEIAVSLPYSVTRYNSDGSVLCSYENPLFIEPDFSSEYILFLEQDNISGHYYRAIEPGIIQNQAGQAVLCSNIVDSAYSVSSQNISSDAKNDDIAKATLLDEKKGDFLDGSSFDITCQKIRLILE